MDQPLASTTGSNTPAPTRTRILLDTNVLRHNLEVAPRIGSCALVIPEEVLVEILTAANLTERQAAADYLLACVQAGNPIMASLEAQIANEVAFFTRGSSTTPEPLAVRIRPWQELLLAGTARPALEDHLLRHARDAKGCWKAMHRDGLSDSPLATQLRSDTETMSLEEFVTSMATSDFTYSALQQITPPNQTLERASLEEFVQWSQFARAYFAVLLVSVYTHAIQRRGVRNTIDFTDAALLSWLGRVDILVSRDKMLRTYAQEVAELCSFNVTVAS